MAHIKLIFNFILAIPEIYKIFVSLWDLYKKDQQDREDKKRKDAFDSMQAAKTIDEVKRANEDITRNLP